ncbi:MAG: hypothetical protein WCG27_10885 [Pseudomonadota bacterium]
MAIIPSCERKSDKKQLISSDRHLSASLTSLFKKAKSANQMNRDQAIKQMNSNVDTAAFRDAFTGVPDPHRDRHIMGIIDEVFPLETATATLVSPAR